jgi:hypothetical protein
MAGYYNKEECKSSAMSWLGFIDLYTSYAAA